MNIFSLVILIILVGLVTWLSIDTAIYVVRRVKEKKKNKVDNDSK